MKKAQLSEVEAYMKSFFTQYRGNRQVIKTISNQHGLKIENQSMRQSLPDAKRKFNSGLDTIILYVQQGSNRIELAKLREEQDGSLVFTNLTLDSYPEVLASLS
jgi:hypothetical protein